MDKGYSEEEWRLIEDSDTEMEPQEHAKEVLHFPTGKESTVGDQSNRGKAGNAESDADVLAQLGVTSVAEADITKRVIEDAERRGEEAQEEPDEGEKVSETEADRRTIRQRLFVLQKEIAAVKAGLEDEADGNAGPGSGVSAGLDNGDGVKLEEDEEGGAEQGAAFVEDSKGEVSLQRALASQRLLDLKAQRRQLKDQLATLESADAPEVEGSKRGGTPADVSREESPAKEVRNEDEKSKGGDTRKRKEGAEERAKKKVRFEEGGQKDEATGGKLDAVMGMLETERDRLIRTGVLTPFSSVQGYEKKVTSSAPGMTPSAPEKQRRPVLIDDDDFDSVFEARTSQRNARQLNGAAGRVVDISGIGSSLGGSDEDEKLQRAIARTAAQNEAIYKAKGTIQVLTGVDVPKQEPIARDFHRKNQKYVKRVSEKEEGVGGKKFRRRRPVPSAEFREKKRSSVLAVLGDEGEVVEDKGKRRRKLFKIKKEEGSDEDWNPESGDEDGSDENEDEGALLPLEEKKPDVVIEGGLRIPGGTYDRLFAYQQTGVKWLWELHCQKAGGIIGDEMGLGKTIQIVAFLGALHYSGLYKPSIIVCPVTLLRQWKREIQAWYPNFKVAILHDSASMPTTKPSRDPDEEPATSEEENESEEEMRPAKGKAGKNNRWDALIADIVNHPDGLLLTSYEQLRIQRDKLLDVQWGYAILDEGHRIRNPDADITLVCKQLQTVHRIVMSGAPIQNKLTELWSLFDFVFPGKLGTLPVFQSQFALPIAIGGYSNASQLQASTAYKCAVVLRDLIMPYLLRRMKADVEAQLPNKTEQVLFVSLTEEQRAVYRSFLASNEVEAIIAGDRNALYGIDIMRKICNHPDLLERDEMASHPDYGNPERSGKLKVVAKILPLWLSQGHRVLLFCQTQQMLDIIENFVANSEFVYRRMDGNTPINQRMAIIDEFNGSDKVFILILTTKVGGLGTNLVGANRVIIFDPDWNPSTDMQARERAWRIGQKRDVTIYRFITSGTIEEKVYHRQIYKHFLTNKILRDPRQRRFFKAKDLTDLFVLGDGDSGRGTETSEIFGGDEKIDQGVNVRARLLNGMRKAKATLAIGSSEQDGAEALEGPRSSRKGKEKVTDDEEGLEGLYREDAVEEKPKGLGEETGLLKSLFESTGVHSTMDHDRIVGANDPENVIVDYEANRVARRAAEALRQSRVARAHADVAVPTWTGRSGAAGAPDGVRRRFGTTVNSRLVQQSTESTVPEGSERFGSKPGGLGGLTPNRGGLSSSALLAKVREGRLAAEEAHIGAEPGSPARLTNGLGTSSRESSPFAQAPPSGQQASVNGLHRARLTSGRENGSSEAANRSKDRSRKKAGMSSQPEILIRQICTFLQDRGGSAPSADLVQHFADRIKADDMALFRQLLKQIATLKKSEGNEPSTWTIKPEYQ